MSHDASTAASMGSVAEFQTADALLDAIRAAKAEQYEKMEAYTPFPMHEVSHLLGHKTKLPWLVFFGGLTGALLGLGLQIWTSAVDYPLNVGGRPFISWPSFIVITFEMTILFASFCAVFGLIGLCGLPRPFHPLFAIERFEGVTRDKFFLMIFSEDPNYDAAKAEAFLKAQSATGVWEVPQ